MGAEPQRKRYNRPMTAPDISTFDLNNLPDEFYDDPFPYYAALREHAPVKRLPDGSYILTRYDDLDRIYRDTTNFLSDKKRVFFPIYGNSPLFEHHTTSLVFNDAPLHTRVRRIMVGALNPRAVARMEPQLERLVDELLGDLEAKGDVDLDVDLIEDFAMRIPVEVIGNLFEIPHSQRGPLREWSLAILGALEPNLTVEQLALGNAAVVEFKAFLKEIADDRRKNPGDADTDVLTRLIAGDGGTLDEVELLQNCIFILNAGHETTTNLIGNALWALRQHPDQLARLKADPSLINTGVDEVLRFLSSNQFGNRETAVDMELGGQKVPKGSNLHLCIGAANRDPAQFQYPDSLDLSRKPNKHLAFAGGAHHCVGFTLAKMEGRIAIGRFVERLPDYRLTETATFSRRIRFRGFTRLPARCA
jgi:cytochrome P450